MPRPTGRSSAAASRAAPSPGLHRRAVRGNRFFGTAIDPGLLAHDPAYMARVPQECGIVVSESAFKWGALRPRPDAYSFDGADALAVEAARLMETHKINGLLVTDAQGRVVGALNIHDLLRARVV